VIQLLLGLVAAAGVGLLYWGMVSTRAPVPTDGLAEGVEQAFEAPAPKAPAAPLGQRVLSGLSALTSPVTSAKRSSKVQDELNRAGIQLRAQEFITMQIGTALLVALLVYLRFGNWFLVVPGLLIGYILPNFYVRRRQRKRQRAFEAQLGDTITLISNGVKAGYSVQQALASVAESGRAPLSDEIARVVREASLGLSLETALDHANTRIQSKSFDLMVTAILIHRSVGGNLAEVLDRINETIRERVKVQGEVRVMTAQARASGYIITGLPFAVGGILSLISPSFERPLFTSALGWGMIVFGLIMISIGYAFIRKITDIHL
jgi:tight adherence protein B